MNVSHKFSEFLFPFSPKQMGTNLASKYVYNPYTYILTKIEQIPDILPISLKSGWSDALNLRLGGVYNSEANLRML